MAEETAQCPHACPNPCATCEGSYAFGELRKLRAQIGAMHDRLTSLTDNHFGARSTMSVERLIEVLEVEVPKMIKPEDAHEAVQSLVRTVWLYSGYKVLSRGPVGLIIDAIRVLEPETAATIAAGDAGDRWELIVEKDDDEPACTRPPPGWWCSRADGHDGPCAARPRSTRQVSHSQEGK